MLLKIGSRGEEVRQLQIALNINADGIFGKETEDAVKKIQIESGLCVDGIVGPKTMNVIISMNFDTDLTEDIEREDKKIEIENYYLPSDEYLSNEDCNGKYINEYICLHHTAGWNNPYNVVNSWSNDKNGYVGTEFIIGGIKCTNGNEDYDGKIIKCFPDGCQAYHLGSTGSSYMNLHTVGIELCNFGYIKDGKTYVGTKVLDSQIVKLKEPFRGYTEWHRYSDEQLKSLSKLLKYVSERDNIDLHVGLYQWIKQKGANKAFEFNEDAYKGNIKGLFTHTNVRKDKFDCSPQDELIDMILSL